MAVGLATATAQGYINVLRNVAYSGIATVYVQCHNGDPGAAGTANVSTGITTRNQLTLNAPSGGSATLGTLASFSATGTDTISHVTLWTASTSGTFIASGALSVSKGVNNGDTLTFNTFTVSFTPIAA